MSFHVLKKACWGKGQSISMNRVSGIFSSKSRSFSQPPSPSQSPPTFGIAFDIDGVLLLGNSPVGGSPSAIRTLYDEAGSLRIPYVLLTNGGGYPESKRALELSRLLGANVSASQVLQGHSPFKQLSNRFKNELVVAVGKGEPAAIMSEYGYNNVLSIDDYASLFENIDPLAQYKRWATKQDADQGSKIEVMTSRNTVCSQRVRAAFIVSDSVDWSRDIQVLCDILRTGGFPGRNTGPQPHLYFANDDLEYQAVFPSERLGMGAFRIALESIFNRIHANPLEYTSFGKPNPSVFRNAEIVLERLAQSIMKKCQEIHDVDVHHFERLYMIGDNPKVDIKGARQAGYPWFSILTRTGVFKGNENHANFPADLVVDTVEEAVDYILRRESRL